MSKEISRIVAQDYSHECGDGCCLTWGTKVWISDSQGVQYYDSDSLESALLEHLDIEVEWKEAERDE